jgi:site-specific DNA recombinase
MTRFAAYARIGTRDKQDPSLSFPSQFEEGRRRVAGLGGSVVCEFTDEQTGADDDRPGWSELVAEARDRANRRFDGVVLYSTSRLSRDRVSAGLFERELRKLGVSIVYAHAGADSSTPEGELTIGVLQVIDQFERSRLKRESRRGMRQNTLGGYRNGGRAPYGYRRKTEPHTNPIQAAAGETKSRLAIDPDQAPIIREIFDLWATNERGVTAIADLLNERRVPCPTATNPRLNATRRWAKSTINAMLRNPVYVGNQVWDRRDNATRREQGVSAPWRREDEWTVCEDAHDPIISAELFAATQERMERKKRLYSRPRSGSREHLLSGMVRCATGHPSLSAYGLIVKGHTYYRCTYRSSYGKVAAEAIAGHGSTCNVREDALLLAIERFFAERLFGPMRLDLLREQLALQESATHTEVQQTAAQLHARIAEADRAIAMQVRALEQGIEPDVVRARIEELKAEKAAAQAPLPKLALAPERTDPVALLDRVPDLSERLRGANDATKRALFDAFDLRVVYDKTDDRLSISATLTEAVASILPTGPLRNDVESLSQRALRGTDSHSGTTLRQDYRLSQ